MECYNCGARLTDSDFCNACGVDVRRYKKIVYASNLCYNDGLERAKVRDLSGAKYSLRLCLKLNKSHIDARNLLGLIYFETGEAVAGLSEWVISKSMKPEKNIASDYIDRIQSNPGRLESLTTTIKKYNKALELALMGSNDLSAIQLKKVLSMNPKYVEAHKLLGLLLMEKGEYEKARKEMDKVLIIDKGNLDALRYMDECETILYPSEDKGKRKIGSSNSIFAENAAKTYKDGNEVIIQPLNSKEPKGISLLIQVMIGIAIGTCITYFLIVPGKVESAKNEMQTEIASYGETIDKKNTEISELESRVAELEQNGLSLKESLENYEGSNGAIDANNYLITAAMAYIKGQEFTDIEEALNLIGSDYIDNSASYEYRELYEYLLAQIGDSVADTYYEAGLEEYGQMDYASAIRDLGKAYLYNPGSDDALYYLALSYYESGDVNNAEQRLNELIAAFPTSPLYDKAKQRLEEIGE